MLSGIVFYLLAVALLLFAYKTISSPNPIQSAFYLVLTMVNLAFIFFTLNAQFVAGVQLVVYAGAVMVLFVIVIMLFDLKTEVAAFSRGIFSGAAKVAAAAMLAGLVIGAARSTNELLGASALSSETVAQSQQTTKDLAILLFSKYLFAFELLGVLLLVVAVGAVAMSRMKGGTHAKH